MTRSINKPFIVLLVVAVAIGVVIGGVFAGGVALGKSSGRDTPTALSSGGPSNSSTNGGGPGGSGRSGRGQFQPGSPSGQSAARPQSPGSTPGGAAVQSYPGRGGVSGTVEKVDGDVVTITTTDGPVEVIVAEDTAMSQISPATAADLHSGVQVRVMGPAGEDGRVQAANLVIAPAGVESPFGQGPRGGQGRQGAPGATATP